MNKKFELNEIELDQIAGGRPRVRPNPALSNAVHKGLTAIGDFIKKIFTPPSKRFPTNQPPVPKTTVEYCVANSKKI